MKIVKLFVLSLLFASIFLTGCSKKVTVDMNQLSDDNKFHYVNEDLKFSLNLPEEFIYYQTQKKTDVKSTNIEFFVPTGDRDYPSTFQGYGKILVVSIYDEANWNSFKDKGGMVQVGQGDGKIYAVQFWQQVPKDWQGKWKDSLTKDIKDSFQVK